MNILNPQYGVKKAGWLLRLLGYSHYVYFYYGVYRENQYQRWSEPNYINRGYFKTHKEALDHCEALENSPEWKRY